MKLRLLRLQVWKHNSPLWDVLGVWRVWSRWTGVSSCSMQSDEIGGAEKAGEVVLRAVLRGGGVSFPFSRDRIFEEQRALS